MQEFIVWVSHRSWFLLYLGLTLPTSVLTLLIVQGRRNPALTLLLGWTHENLKYCFFEHRSSFRSHRNVSVLAKLGVQHGKE